MRRDSKPRRDFLKTVLGAAVGAAAPRVWAGGSPAPARVGGFRNGTESLDDLFAGLQCYFGDLHAHTGYSDGFGTPPWLYQHGRNQNRLDFCAVSDHGEWINFFQSRLKMQDGSPIPLWENILAEVEAQYLPGSFVSFPGLEWTSDAYGHRTLVFGDTANVPSVPPSSVSHPTPADLWQALEPYVAMTIPHHVTRWGTLMDWSHYNPATDRLVEIYSKWGNGASAWTSYDLPTKLRQYPSLRSQAAPSGVDAMLELGHRIGIIGASDSHQGHPGSTAPEEPEGTILPADQYPTSGEGFLEALELAYTFDQREPSGGGGGLAGVWAGELTREAIWEGLYERRTLGTTGIRPSVKFGVRDGGWPSSGAVMGRELTVVGDPVLYASAVAEPGSTVSHIVLLKTNDPLLIAQSPEPGVAVSTTDPGLAIGETACYRALVLIRQDETANTDGDTILMYDRERDRFFQSPNPRLDEQIWTSPVWVTREPA